MTINKLAASFVAIILMLLSGVTASALEKKYVTIGTGGPYGVYYPAGGAICQFVNRGRKEDHGIRCFVEMTSGSIANLNAIREGELDIGAAQSDWHYNAYTGKGLFADFGPNKKLRSLFSLHSEPFTVVVRADSGIKAFDDLRGKHVNVGSPGSGMQATLNEVIKAKGWDESGFAKTSEFSVTEQAQALCDNKIDAMVFVAGHPNGSIKEATSVCDAKIIPVDGPAIDKLLAENPYYTKAVIPANMYNNNATDVPTFGMRATFVTSEEVDDEIIYQVVKAVFENFDSFKTLHFVFATLDKNEMVSNGLIAPLHEGAKRYYREAGLLPE